MEKDRSRRGRRILAYRVISWPLTLTLFYRGDKSINRRRDGSSRARGGKMTNVPDPENAIAEKLEGRTIYIFPFLYKHVHVLPLPSSLRRLACTRHAFLPDNRGPLMEREERATWTMWKFFWNTAKVL